MTDSPTVSKTPNSKETKKKLRESWGLLGCFECKATHRTLLKVEVRGRKAYACINHAWQYKRAK